MNAVPPNPTRAASADHGPIARLEELLAGRLAGASGLSGLDAAEARELAALEAQFPAEAAGLEFDLAEAATVVRGGRVYGMAAAGAWAIPAGVEAAVIRDAGLILGGPSAGATAGTAATVTAAAGGAAGGLTGLTWRGLAVAGWLAAAASLATAAWLGRTIWTQPTVDGGVPIVVDPRSEAVGSAEVPMLSYRVVKAPDALRVPLVGAGGEAVWSAGQQAGLLQVEDLPALDSAEAQYQLWVVDVDRPRGADHVDAGLFDVGEGEVVRTLAFRPRLPVGRLGGVVITRVAPGGSTLPGDGEAVASGRP